MAATAPLKILSYMKELIAQADHPKEPNRVKKWMASRYSSLQIKRHIISKNPFGCKFCFEKNLLTLQFFCFESHPNKRKCLQPLLKKLLYLMNDCNCCSEIERMKEWKSAFVHLRHLIQTKITETSSVE